ncbi:P-loop NTPase fold protein [Lacinutrix algicola]|uniref:P-loop NTPase fold protein n=1 Tax=Lacinutrix algicola TaxID=342954 RepID=UPI0006E26876|nr:P-loop NTPase fold protein [Lacinutrix algicola]
MKKSQDSTEEAFGEIIKIASMLFRGFSRSVRISMPGLSIDGNKIVESLEDEPDATFLELKNSFKTEFIRWEDNKTPSKQKSFNIVFIDDLDRCEPENVLNLLSALKLFFTYGKKTIFFCGIDKKAVKEAVKTKYGEVVKANEYLEKIFDISFTMPEYKNILKLVDQYFDKREDDAIKGSISENISFFFEAIKFTNPRRVKKVLNKLQLLRSVINNNLNHGGNKNITNIYSDKTGNYLETILTIYLIILHEFHPTSYEKVFDIKAKEMLLLRAVKGVTGSAHYKVKIEGLMKKDIVNKPLNSLSLDRGQLEDLIFVFAPDNIELFNTPSFNMGHYLGHKLKKETIESRFLDYLINNPRIVSNSNEFSEISFIEMKEMVKLFL